MDDVTKQLQEEITILQSELDRITAQTSQFKTEIRTAKKEMPGCEVHRGERLSESTQ